MDWVISLKQAKKYIDNAIASGGGGSDGKSLEFKWNGTKLGIRVEGTTDYTYVDLKGSNGTNGTNGTTPVRGTDYWTNEDIETIKAYCRTYIDSLSTQ